MIQEFIDRFDKARGSLLAGFKAKAPGSYKEIVTRVIEVVTTDDYDAPDPKRIHVIDDGDYQGTLVFVIGGCGYQPSDYWYVKVGYGSCSGCDTLEAIGGYDDEVSDEQAGQYLTLALHIVQGLKKMGDKP